MGRTAWTPTMEKEEAIQEGNGHESSQGHEQMVFECGKIKHACK